MTAETIPATNETRRIEIQASGVYELAADTCLLLMVEPNLAGAAHKVLQHELLTTPTPTSDAWTDEIGNFQRRLLAPAGAFRFDYRATIETVSNTPIPDDAVQHTPLELPLDAFVYLRPSRYCPSDRLERLATDLFGSITAGGERVNAVASWVHENVEYQYGTSNAQTSALDTLIERVGVCRDFAHLTISFCRALGLPARYVSGYALGLKPCDFHGYVQVFVGGEWRNVDATFPDVRPALIPIAIGRDAADVAMLTTMGPATVQEQTVMVREIEGTVGDNEKPFLSPQQNGQEAFVRAAC
jgi:transglutaminase-like putative cysteine protease